MKVGIYGYGFVGQAVDHILDDSTPRAIYDKNIEKYNKQSEMLSCDIIFICVPTPTNSEGHDSSAVQDALEYFREHEYKGLVVVKSTVLYDALEDHTSDLKLLFNPEFLNQNSFAEDAVNQNVVLIGGELGLGNKLKNFYRTHTCIRAHYEFMTMKEACDFKYIRNIYGAYKVLFWEFVQDTTGNARKMAELYSKVHQPEMTQVGMDGERGYGGACFPKDVQAWHHAHDHDLTTFMTDFNKILKDKI